MQSSQEESCENFVKLKTGFAKSVDVFFLLIRFSRARQRPISGILKLFAIDGKVKYTSR
jgi:hypothetical protein